MKFLLKFRGRVVLTKFSRCLKKSLKILNNSQFSWTFYRMDEKKLIYCKHTVKSSSVLARTFKRASKSKGRPEVSLVRAYLVPIFCTPVSCILGTWLEFPMYFSPIQSSPVRPNPIFLVAKLASLCLSTRLFQGLRRIFNMAD